MSERPVTLDLRTPPQAAGGMPTPTRRDTLGSADREAAQRFQHALSDRGPDSEAAASGQPMPSPFDLRLEHSSGAPALDPPGEPARLVDAVCDLVDRILVGDGRSGRREVRLTLSDDLLPGVSVCVYQSEGAWIADFETTDPHSFQQLAAPAPDMARQLATLLHHDAVWQVADRSDPSRLIRARSAAGSEQSA